MKQIIYLLVSITWLNSCGSNESKTKNSSSESDLSINRVHDNVILDSMMQNNKTIEELKKKNIQYIDDTAKWYLYNIYYNEIIPSRTGSISDSNYVLFSDLVPGSYSFSKDSSLIDITYTFILDGQKIEYLVEKPIAIGLRVDLKTRSVIKYFTIGNGSFTITSNNFIDINKIDKTFLNKHRNKINKWYKDALLKHGITF